MQPVQSLRVGAGGLPVIPPGREPAPGPPGSLPLPGPSAFPPQLSLPQAAERLRAGCLSPSARRGLEEKGDSGEQGVGSLQWDPGAKSRAFQCFSFICEI